MRVVEINLHMHKDGVLVSVLQRDYKGALPVRKLLWRRHLAGLDEASPADVVLDELARMLLRDRLDREGMS